MTGPIHRLTVDHTAAVRLAAQQIRRETRRAGRTVIPELRQAVVVSNDGGQPPTCTIRTGDSATLEPGTRYAWPLVPVAGDLVYTVAMDGDKWVSAKIRNNGCPAYLETTTTITGVTAEAMNSATFLTVWLEANRRYMVEGQFRADSTAANVVNARIRHAVGANPTTASTLDAAWEGPGNTGAAGAQTAIMRKPFMTSGVAGNRTFGISTAVAVGGGSTAMAVGLIGVIWLAVTEFT